MITVDATLDISGMASGECILPEVDANGGTVREPFLNSAAYKFGESLVSTLLTRATLLPTAARLHSHLPSASSVHHASRSQSYLLNCQRSVSKLVSRVLVDV